MALDGLMFDNSLFYPFVVTFGFLISKALVRPHIFYDVVMHEVVKGEVFKFTGRIGTNNWMVLC